MAEYLCMDIGGTAIKFAKFSESGERLTPVQMVQTRLTKTENFIMEAVLDIVAKNKVGISGVAVSSAGVVDTERGEISYAGYTIPGYTGTKIKERIEEAHQLSCQVENDVNCAALGEFYLGGAKNFKSVLCLTIGTGIGGAFLADGKLLRGASNRALEIGYMGVNGKHFQELAATSELIRQASLVTGEVNLTGKSIMKRALNGDSEIQKIVDVWICNLAAGLVNLIYVLNPEVIILGGGIMEQKTYFKPRIETAVLDQLVSDSFNTAKIEFATLGNEAGMVGALYHFLSREGRV
ncbi:ROK family protein [Listeria sp. ILCC797]|uniref:ROK family protein n=1 Tax=Listeria sp. ILCC797 TaxID=1918333 RepID=UPI000B58CDE3|nr:ROK family protein [Listeria sp. ILCC797]